MEPPNRAIVTELVTRGSLWEVLRTPNLFNTNTNTNNNVITNANNSHSHRSSSSSSSFATTMEGSPADDGGDGNGGGRGFFWPPWAVRRVLDDTCRGLAYLHSFDPPIIHRGGWALRTSKHNSSLAARHQTVIIQCIIIIIIIIIIIPYNWLSLFLSVARPTISSISMLCNVILPPISDNPYPLLSLCFLYF